MDKPDVMTLKEAAKLYPVKLSTLRLWCVTKKIASTKPGKHRFVTRETMDEVTKGVGK